MSHIMIISVDKTDALLIKKGLQLLDSKFQSEEELDNKNLYEERTRITNIVSELNFKFNI